jgi:hypothetical protein
MRLIGCSRVSLVLVGLFAISNACTAIEPDDGGAGGGDASDDGGDGADDGGDDGADDGGDDGADDGGGTSGVCTTATLFAGNPLYDGDETPDPAGAGLLDDPPLWWRGTVFDGDRLYTDTGEELWMADLSAAEPRVVRIAGDLNVDAFNDGPCADARLLSTHGIALLPDGSLAVADYNANAIVKVTDPAGPGCTVSYLAGTSEPLDSNPSDVPNQGDIDGPGLTARFRGVKWPVADGKGGFFFVDESNNKVKRVAADAASTVSTVATMADYDVSRWGGMTLLGGKLYLVGNGGSTGSSSNANSVVEVDPASGEVRTVVEGNGDTFAPVDAGEAPYLGAITNNGTDLYVAGGGFIWRVGLDGTLTHVAGAGNPLDFPPDGYDPSAQHAALDVLLPFNLGAGLILGTTVLMTYHEGALYYSTVKVTGHYIEKIDCP